MNHSKEDNYLPLKSPMSKYNNAPLRTDDPNEKQQQTSTDLINNTTSINDEKSNRGHDLNDNKNNTNNNNSNHQHNSNVHSTSTVLKEQTSITIPSKTLLNNNNNNTTQPDTQTTTTEPVQQSVALYILNELNHNIHNQNDNTNENNNINNDKSTSNVKDDIKVTSQFSKGREDSPRSTLYNNIKNSSLYSDINENMTKKEKDGNGSPSATEQTSKPQKQAQNKQQQEETSNDVNLTSLQTPEFIIDDLPFINGLDAPLNQQDLQSTSYDYNINRDGKNNNNNNTSNSNTDNLNNDTNTYTNGKNEEDPQSNEQPYYVNAKQYYRILKRRYARAKLEERLRVSRERKPYLHESRHKHAMRRPRGQGGRFLTAAEIKEKKTQEKESDRIETADKNNTRKNNYDNDINKHKTHSRNK